MNGVVETLKIKTAAENNLKGIDVDIPLGMFTVVTGPSGSGKTSLVYDTLYAESQRCFAESFGIELRELPRPHVGAIENLRPALCVSQFSYNRNPRSTVGTVTDISYLIRTLFAVAYQYETGTYIRNDVFSPNSPYGCCRVCKGTGVEKVVDVLKLIPDQRKTLKDGAITVFATGSNQLESVLLHEYCKAHKINENVPINRLPKRQIDQLLNADGSESFHIAYKTYNGKKRSRTHSFVGAIKLILDQIHNIDKPSVALRIDRFLKDAPCHICGGSKLGEIGTTFQLCGKTISAVEKLDMTLLLEWIADCKNRWSDNRSMVDICNGIESRIQIIKGLNLSYLTLERTVPTLSGGEMQRIRLSKQITCSLSGLIYILDEPCKGLHPIDVQSIISSIRLLVNKGNTIVAIEHNDRCIKSADRIILLGPVGGVRGGYLMPTNLTSNSFRIVDHFQKERQGLKFNNKWKSGPCIKLNGITYNNLNLKEVVFPVGGIVGMTGVSGSGKSSLMKVLEQSVNLQTAWNCKSLQNNSPVEKVEFITQNPIGKSPRSIVASYLSVYDDIRNSFAILEDSKKKGLTAADFSVNVVGGRCEKCHGTGVLEFNMSYCSDTFIKCPECEGARFSKKVLSVRRNGKTINDLLNCPLSSVYEEYKDCLAIRKKIQILIDLGLDYIQLGMPTQKLSGGESQRLKLTKILGGLRSHNVLYLLDEPSSGLSSCDCEKLANTLFKVAKQSCGLIIVEHNMDLLKVVTNSLIDLGKCAGMKGGSEVCCGTIQEVSQNPKSSWYDSYICKPTLLTNNLGKTRR